ncbi:hypothetical protein Vi05172_g3640 [Venturia inaequalis]|nr:hypothetical protein Vi05172_g3640 [Venturia inaequalis]
MFKLALLSLSFLAGFAAATDPIVNIQSYCPYPIYLSQDVSLGGPIGLVTVLQQGQNYKYLSPLDKPVSLKFSKEWQHEWGYKPGTRLTGWIPLTQFEYNWESNHMGLGRYIQYNWSNVDCKENQECPFTEYGMVAERTSCPTFECKPGDRKCKECYQVFNDDGANVGCYLDALPQADMELSLCNYLAPHAKVRRSRIWAGEDNVVSNANSTLSN